ncbi:MAG: response regulator transcription factor [Oscillospiraceae bacterium]|nr:response regulator transcription factor [Oscillospiraceae bacterium]
MRILLVEDDEAISEGLRYSLVQEGYDVRLCARKETALAALRETAFDLLLLDVMLPDGSGYDVCRFAKQRGDTPVLFLTACDEEVNVVMGLDMGADDYITKPFRVRELQSRIRSVLRRCGGQKNIYRFGPLMLDASSARVSVEGADVPLTALEYRLLLTFAAHPGQVLTRGQLLSGLWDEGGNFVNDNTLTVYIKRLREKLAEAGAGGLIRTVRGMGYQLEDRHEE